MSKYQLLFGKSGPPSLIQQGVVIKTLVDNDDEPASRTPKAMSPHEIAQTTGVSPAQLLISAPGGEATGATQPATRVSLDPALGIITSTPGFPIHEPYPSQILNISSLIATPSVASSASSDEKLASPQYPLPSQGTPSHGHQYNFAGYLGDHPHGLAPSSAFAIPDPTGTAMGSGPQGVAGGAAPVPQASTAADGLPVMNMYSAPNHAWAGNHNLNQPIAPWPMQDMVTGSAGPLAYPAYAPVFPGAAQAQQVAAAAAAAAPAPAAQDARTPLTPPPPREAPMSRQVHSIIAAHNEGVPSAAAAAAAGPRPSFPDPPANMGDHAERLRYAQLCFAAVGAKDFGFLEPHVLRSISAREILMAPNPAELQELNRQFATLRSRRCKSNNNKAAKRGRERKARTLVDQEAQIRMLRHERNLWRKSCAERAGEEVIERLRAHVKAEMDRYRDEHGVADA